MEIQDFSTTQILREINFMDSRRSEIFQNTKIIASENAKRAVFQVSESLKLISCKNLETKNPEIVTLCTILQNLSKCEVRAAELKFYNLPAT